MPQSLHRCAHRHAAPDAAHSGPRLSSNGPPCSATLPRRTRARSVAPPPRASTDKTATSTDRASCQEQLVDAPGLLIVERASARAPASALGFERPQPAQLVQRNPFVHRPKTRPKHLRRMDLLHPSTHGVYHLPPQQLLRRGFELPGIISFVHTSLTHHALFGARISKSLKSPGLPASDRLT